MSRLRPASLALILAAVKAKGAQVVLLNVWATWCEPCLEELPDLLRFYRDHRAQGLRLVMVSANDIEQEGEARRVLHAAMISAGLGRAPFDAVVFIKDEDDTVFVNGLDPGWSGALPATFAFNGQGERKRVWRVPVTYAALREGTKELFGLTAPKTGSDSRSPSSSAAPRQEPKLDRSVPP